MAEFANKVNRELSAQVINRTELTVETLLTANVGIGFCFQWMCGSVAASLCPTPEIKAVVFSRWSVRNGTDGQVSHI